jgi:hypothetical protein
MLRDIDDSFNEFDSLIEDDSEPYTSMFSIQNIFGNSHSRVKKTHPHYTSTNRFYIDVYEYYQKRGISNIFLLKIVEILSLIFGIFFIFTVFLFSTFLFAFFLISSHLIKTFFPISKPIT